MGAYQQSMLLLGQWLQAISHPKLFSWANSARLITPFVDWHHSSYKAKLAWTAAFGTLCSSFSVCFQSAAGLQYYLASNTGGNWNSSYWASVNGYGVYTNWCIDVLDMYYIILRWDCSYAHMLSATHDNHWSYDRTSLVPSLFFARGGEKCS